MSDNKLKLNPAQYGEGFKLPDKYAYLSGAHTDSLFLELIQAVERLQDRVEELERWLPVPPEEEDFEDAQR